MQQLEHVCGQWVGAHAAPAWRRRRARLSTWRGRPARHIAWRRQHEGARSLAQPLRRRAPSAPCRRCCPEAQFNRAPRRKCRLALQQVCSKSKTRQSACRCPVLVPHRCIVQSHCTPVCNLEQHPTFTARSAIVNGTCVHPSLANRQGGVTAGSTQELAGPDTRHRSHVVVCLACERGAAAEQSETDAAAWQSLCPKRTERCSWSASTASPVRRAVCSFPPWSHSQSRKMAAMRLLA